MADAQAALQPPATSGRRLKIYYATQQGVQPPTFVLFVNDMELMHFSYERYLENQFRKSFGFEGTPFALHPPGTLQEGGLTRPVFILHCGGMLMVWRYAVIVVAGYLLGNISMGLIVSERYHMDIREHGSGNAGTTNVLRTLGWLPSV